MYENEDIDFPVAHCWGELVGSQYQVHSLVVDPRVDTQEMVAPVLEQLLETLDYHGVVTTVANIPHDRVYVNRAKALASAGFISSDRGNTTFFIRFRERSAEELARARLKPALIIEEEAGNVTKKKRRKKR